MTAPDTAAATAPQKLENTDVIDVIVNKRSGTVLRVGEEAVEAGLKESLGKRLGSITFVEGKDIIPTVRQWTVDQAGKGRGLILGGGDGSVLAAAEVFMNRDDITLGVLPLGTHNLFARQLGFSADFKEAAKLYASLKTDKVDVGNVNGENFLVGLMIDQNSVDFYKARELHRDKKLVKAGGKFIASVFGIVAGRKATLDVSGTEQKGRVFIVTNNQFQPRANEGLPPLLPTPDNMKPVIENILAKGDSDGLLGFYAFKGGSVNFTMLVPKLWDGTWPEAKSVKVQTAPELVIQPGDKSGGSLPIILDGEVKQAQYPLNVKILPQALKVYKPA
jgi:diacylglycerol kinase family enzyme